MTTMQQFHFRHTRWDFLTLWVCGITHSCPWHESSMCVTWLMHVWYVTHSRLLHGSFLAAKQLIYVCDMACLWHEQSCLWNDSFVSVSWLIHTEICLLFVDNDWNHYVPTHCIISNSRLRVKIRLPRSTFFELIHNLIGQTVWSVVKWRLLLLLLVKK